MLSKKERISRIDFPKVKGGRVHFEFGTLSFFPSLPPSAAVVVPKKSFKTSVVRHRVKRRILAILGDAVRSGKVKLGIVACPNGKALWVDPKNLRISLEAALLKIPKP